MYDPEEACNEEDENVKLEPEETAEPEKEEAPPVQPKEEVKEEPQTMTPRTRRMGGAVKNGAGPKSKKLRKQ